MVLGEAALREAKAYLRVVGDEEDPLIERLLRTSAECCEQFTRQALIARIIEEVTGASGSWTRLGAAPVRVIAGVEALPAEGAAYPLRASDYAVDIDAGGDGWVRVLNSGGAKRVRVQFEAGLAPEWAGLPDALRQGLIRLTAHLYMHRDGAVDAGPPAAVTALWRPWRRMSLGPRP